MVTVSTISRLRCSRRTRIDPLSSQYLTALSTSTLTSRSSSSGLPLTMMRGSALPTSRAEIPSSPSAPLARVAAPSKVSMVQTRVLPDASASGRKSSTSRRTMLARSTSSRSARSMGSSVRASSMSSPVSLLSRAVCARVLLVQELSPSVASMRSVLAEMIAMGVLSSCEASVTNRFCRSRLRT